MEYQGEQELDEELEPSKPDDQEGEPDQPVGEGRWLEEPPDVVAKEIDEAFGKQEKYHDLVAAIAKRNELWKSGKRNVQFVEDEDTSAIRVYAPKGTLAAAPVANKTDDLCSRVVATILTDKHKPECEPATDSDEDRDGAELMTRILVVDDSEAGVNMPALAESSLDRANVWGSDFTYWDMDPKGGGWQPMQLEANPKALTEEDPQRNPETGKIEGPYVLKYVTKTGELSDSATDAKKVWVPKEKAIQLRPVHVAMQPQWATKIDKANGAILCIPMAWGDLEARFPEEMGAMSEDDIKAMMAFMPKKAKRLLPGFVEKEVLNRDKDEQDGRPASDTLVFPYLTYFRSCAEYPEGAYVVTLGTKMIYRGTRAVQLPQDSKGSMKSETLEIPVSQLREFDDNEKDLPAGRGLVEKLGPLDEVRATFIGAAIDYVYREANPNWFLPHGSTIQPGQLNRRDGTPIMFNAAQGTPVQEKIDQLSGSIDKMIEFITAEMNTRSGLEQAAQGVEDPSVQSGIHARTIVEQALIALGAPKRGVDDWYVRSWRIRMQNKRAFMPGDQQLKYTGEDGSFKVKAWNRIDLGGTRDVKIARGSGTMMPSSAKNQLVLEQLQMQLIDMDDAKRAINSDTSGLLGMQDNPHLQRIKGSIDDWSEGPADELAEEEQRFQTEELPMLMQQIQLQYQQAQQQAVAAGADPAMVPPPQPPPGPTQQAAMKIFQERLVDKEQLVAVIRHAELQRTMSQKTYGRYLGTPWQAGFDMAYEAARKAAGVQTLEEQAMAQQAQAQAQAQAEEGKEGRANEAKEKQAGADREFKAKEADADRAVQQQGIAAKAATAAPGV